MNKIHSGIVLASLATFVSAPAFAAKFVNAAPSTVFSDNFEQTTNKGFGSFAPQGKVNVIKGSAYTSQGFSGNATAQANHYAAFGSGNTSPSAGSLLSATITAASNVFTRYTLTFAAGAIGGGAGVAQQYLSTAASDKSGEVFSRDVALTGSTDLNQALQNYSFTFDAKGPLSFSFFGGGSSTDSADTLLDNVTVTASAVPEMATWGMMIVGFCAVGGTIRSRRRGDQNSADAASAMA